MTYNYQTIKQLGQDVGVPVADLCALAPKNDPFYTGRPSEQTAAEWFAGLWQQLGFGDGTHLRRVHYRAISQKEPILRPNGKPYLNTRKDWAYLNEAGKWARYLGLVSPTAFVDRRNPDALIMTRWQDPTSPTYEAAPRFEVSSWHDRGRYSTPDLPELDSLPWDVLDAPHYNVYGYDPEQAYHVEVWAEKTTMNDVLIPVCERYGVNLITGAGELSITAVVDFLGRVTDADRPARILYVSDFDPAGLGMPISIARKIEYFQRSEGYGDLDIRLQPITLTGAQVKKFHLPRVPVEDSKRKARWELNHGKGQVELDALEALYPGELATLTAGAILKYFDTTLDRRAGEARRNCEKALRDKRWDIIESHREELDALEERYQAIKDAYEDVANDFNASIEEEFKPRVEASLAGLDTLAEEAGELHDRILKEMEEVSTDPATDYPLPEAELAPNDDGVLYVSGREYMEQLGMYRAYRNGWDLPDVEQGALPGLGGE